MKMDAEQLINIITESLQGCNKLHEFLAEDNRKMREAGCNLAIAALRV